MIEYTSLEVSERLLQARSVAADGRGHDEMGNCDSPYRWYALEHHRLPRLLPYVADVGEVMGQSEIAPAYNTGTLVTWLVECGYGIEIVRDATGDIHASAGQYNSPEVAIAPTLPDVLAEVVMKVLGVQP